MNGRITLARIFTSLKEGVEYRPSLIGYTKRDWEITRVPIQRPVSVTDKPLTEVEPGFGVSYITVVSAYQHHLYINLWLIELDFEWLGSISE